MEFSYISSGWVKIYKSQHERGYFCIPVNVFRHGKLPVCGFLWTCLGSRIQRPQNAASPPDTLRRRRHNLFSFELCSRSLHQINTAPYESYHRARLLVPGRKRTARSPSERMAGSNLWARLEGEKQGTLSTSLSIHKHLLWGHPANGLLDTISLQ